MMSQTNMRDHRGRGHPRDANYHKDRCPGESERFKNIDDFKTKRRRIKTSQGFEQLTTMHAKMRCTDEIIKLELKVCLNIVVNIVVRFIKSLRNKK